MTEILNCSHVNIDSLMDLVERMSIQQEGLESDNKRLRAQVDKLRKWNDLAKAKDPCVWCNRLKDVGHTWGCPAMEPDYE